MANTGIKQAVVVYKVRKSDGAPLDVNGELISVSGRKQAIALLEGYPNPNTNIYEVEFTFLANSQIEDTPTTEYSDDCLSGYIVVTPNEITLNSELGINSAILSVASSAPWELVANTPVLTVTPMSGESGATSVTISRTALEGLVHLQFKNTLTNQIATVTVTSINNARWILTTGFWDDLGFWYNDGVWNY